MSFPLRRLPFLAINEVIQSMDTSSIFFLSVLSKKSANLVILSMRKNFLSAEFIFKEDGFLFELIPKGFIKHGAIIHNEVPYRTENESVIMRFPTSGRYVQCEWTSTFEVEKSTRKLFYRFSRIFKNSKFYIRFEYNTREEFAMEMMRFAWENGFPLDRIDFYLKNASSESIQELLNRCNGEHTSLFIRAKIPKDFKCIPPPGGYKFKTLAVQYAHWVNLDDLLQCQKVSFTTELPDLTVEYLNDLLKKIVNMECRLNTFQFPLKPIEPSDFPEIVEGLSESAIKRDRAWWQELQFKRKDGLILLVSLKSKYLFLNEDYLKHFLS